MEKDLIARVGEQRIPMKHGCEAMGQDAVTVLKRWLELGTCLLAGGCLASEFGLDPSDVLRFSVSHVSIIKHHFFKNC